MNIFTKGSPRLLNNIFRSFGPVGVSIIGSLLLSIIAISENITPNNDGMLYIHAAGLYQEQGFAAAAKVFDWLFLPILIASVSLITGLGLEMSAYALSSVFIAGVCALAVVCTRIQFPKADWAACAIVLALPALNVYRDYIIREFGCWFFLFLALWCALRWNRNPTWVNVICSQSAILIAALFRPEVLVFIFALILWQVSSLKNSGGLKRLIMMATFPVIAVILIMFALIIGVVDMPGRVLMQISSADPFDIFNNFGNIAERMAETVLIKKRSSDEAASILFFGMLSIIPIKLVTNMGVFIVPLIYGISRYRFKDMIKAWAPISWIFMAYLLVLTGFLFTKMYLVSRYVALLDLLIIPLIAIGLTSLFHDKPKWRWFMTLIIGIVMLANVISTSPKKTHYPAAASWLMQQDIDPARVYIQDLDVRYLAGQKFTKFREWGSSERKVKMTRDMLAEAIANNEYDLVLVSDTKKSHVTEDWAGANNLIVLESFYDAKGRGVMVLQPAQMFEHRAPEITDDL